MWQRLALVISVTALLVLLAAGWAAARRLAADRRAAADDRAAAIANGFERELQTRLQMADSVVEHLTVADVASEGLALRQRTVGSDPFRRLLLVPWRQVWREEHSPTRAATGLPELGPAERLKLSGGERLLRTLPAEAGREAVYLVHMVNLGGTDLVGFFEFAPAWLWQGATQLPDAVSIAVLDAAGQVVYQRAPAPPEIGRMFASAAIDQPGAAIDQRDPERAIMRDWQQGGAEWHGCLVRFDPLAARLSGPPWSIVVYDQVGQLWPALRAIAAAFWPLLILAGMAAGIATRYLTLRWQPVLARFDAALAALRHGQFERVGLQGAADTPRALVQSYNEAIAALEQHLGAQARLAEIDRLLLEAADLEGSLQPILQRVCALTSAHVAAVAMVDRDAPGHARSFAIGADGTDSPISRINLDDEITLSLQDCPEGIAVQPQHLDRYSFLAQLGELGAEVCYVWPITAGNQVAAMLSIGYRGALLPAQPVLSYGAACASRLQIALSNQTRDEQLYRQAHFDSLTSLPNRLLFRDRLSQELASAGDGPHRGALLYVDLDHFKKVNDSVGHIAGDQLLIIVAQRLRACVKDGDTVARLGGDEFSVILRNLPSAEAATEIAGRIIESVRRPVNIAGRDQQVSASIGITLFPDDGTTIEDLLRNADLAMYQAKDSGRARAAFYDRKMARTRLSMADSGLFRALRRRELALHYQPQYVVSSGELIGLEALLRWHSTRDGMRLPADFVPAAEQSGLIVDIGTWVLESACRQLAIWRDEGIAPARLALNVSVHQLRVANFAELVRQTLERTGLPPQMLELEVTETVFAEEEARQTLRQLAAMGVRLALDDFGTGYSSLSYLRQHPFHALKIDRSFMNEVPDSPQATTLVATIIDMAHALGKQVVAEGVETLQQLDFLCQHGCDMAQGFVLSRPLSVVDVTEQLTQRKGGSPLLLQDAAG